MTHMKGYTQNLLTCCEMRLEKTTLKSPRLSWENDLCFLWLLKLFERQCGVWGTAVLVLTTEAEGHWRRGRVCPGLLPDALTLHPTQGIAETHSWAGDKTSWEYLWEMYLRRWKTTAQQWGTRGGSVRNSKWEKEGREPQGWSRDSSAAHSGDRDHASSPAASGGPMLDKGKRVRSK